MTGSYRGQWDGGINETASKVWNTTCIAYGKLKALMMSLNNSKDEKGSMYRQLAVQRNIEV